MIIKPLNSDSLDLDITQLEDGSEYEKICYLFNYKSGITKFDKGFYTFYVKDVNGNMLPAQLFNLEDYVNEGFKALLMKDKPVKIRFISQIYNGSWSLIIREIESWDGEFDYAKYLGVAEYVSDVVEDKYKQLFNKNISPEYYSQYFPEICDGRVGGFISLLEKSFMKLYSYSYKDLDCENLLKCFFISIDAYFNYLKLKKTCSVVATNEMLDILDSIKFEYGDYSYLKEVLDTSMCLFGIVKPQHIYSHLICDIVMQTNEHLSLIYKNRILPFGSSINTDGRILIKY